MNLTTLIEEQKKEAKSIVICICKDRGEKRLCKTCGKPTVKAQVRKLLTTAVTKGYEIALEEVVSTEAKLAIYEDGQQAGEKIATQRIARKLEEVFMQDDGEDSYIALSARIALFIKSLTHLKKPL